jgi:hypothetical protein
MASGGPCSTFSQYEAVDSGPAAVGDLATACEPVPLVPIEKLPALPLAALMPTRIRSQAGTDRPVRRVRFLGRLIIVVFVVVAATFPLGLLRSSKGSS